MTSLPRLECTELATNLTPYSPGPCSNAQSELWLTKQSAASRRDVSCRRLATDKLANPRVRALSNTDNFFTVRVPCPHLFFTASSDHECQRHKRTYRDDQP